ncbi:MAG: hypothetical protein LBK69_03345 [Syntrophomonadaceae bacterium]|nr:hypothetical protein [Syntrophomonadaceae bacterium]
MFEKQYKNEMEKVAPSQHLISLTKAAMRAEMEPKRQRSVFKAAVSLAMAAAICLVLIGTMLLTPQADNAFFLKAYAMEQQSDGTIELREVDLLEQTSHWSSNFDGKELYLNIDLKCEGENIKSVDFYTDDGFFAKQQLKIIDGKIIYEAGVPAIGWTDAEGRSTVTMYGRDFEKIGSEFTLNENDITDDLLLFLGMELTTEDWDWVKHIPPQMAIRAVATFHDGKTQEETLTLDFSSGMGVGRGPVHTPEEIRKHIIEITDITKITDAFISEAKNQGLGEVEVNSVEISGEPDEGYKGIWRVTYDVLPENGTEWLVNQSCDVQLSINERDTFILSETNGEIAQISPSGYTVKILEE